MRLHRKHYAALLFLIALFGSLSLTGMYPGMLLVLFFVCLLALFGGLLRESDSKVVEGTEAEADDPADAPHAQDHVRVSR